MKITKKIRKQVLSSIEAITNEKKEAKKHPDHVMFYELYKRTGIPEYNLRDILNEIYKEGLIETGRSINERWIRLK